jgi:SAM-dependent methyltransferase
MNGTMSTLIGRLKKTYRAVVPVTVRQADWLHSIKSLAYRHVIPHNLVYDWDWYKSYIEEPAAHSAETISESIISDIGPHTVVDVGCGTGALLKALQSKGCEVFGLECSEVALRYCRNRGLTVMKFDLERDDFSGDQAFDIAISFEVAEHLPERAVRRYVDLLTRLSGVVLFTAAPPGQGGHDHVNEQPPSYWISMFKVHGYGCDEELAGRWREQWRASGGVVPWYYSNLLIFRSLDCGQL